MACQDLFWVPHKDFVWLPGKVKRPNVYETEEGDVSLDSKTVKELESLGGTMALSGVDDCCSLVQISSGAILHTIRVRYFRGDIYTNVGNILIAVNPFKPLSIYSTEYLEEYRRATDVTKLRPHIFGFCTQIFHGLMFHSANQSVLISGESGAGKTESMKLVLYFMSSALAGQDGGLEDLLMELNPILESFGNAKTTRNNNSSRFGKWIEVQVATSTRSLLGCKVCDYLLEVTRVCGQGPHERNYHIFYQLLADPEMKEKLKLQTARKATYLKDNPLTVDGMDDAKEFRNLKKAFGTLGVSEEQQESLYRIVAAILHLGNVDFVSAGDVSTLANGKDVALVAELLQVGVEQLTRAMLFRRITTMNEVCFSPLCPEKSRASRDAIAKLLYGNLFKWLVEKCNLALDEVLSKRSNEADKMASSWLGVLDIAGFESFETNMLEQLLINFSNEKLQQLFNKKVFKCEIEEYKAEQVPLDNIRFADNIDVLDLIERPNDGLLSMLDDATTGVKQTDQSYTDKLVDAKGKHARFIRPTAKMGRLKFGIRHYAGEVFYTSAGFLEKNSANTPPEVLEIFRSSTDPTIQQLGHEEDASASTLGVNVGSQMSVTSRPPRKSGTVKRKMTVSLVFRRSLQQLMDKLGESNCNFVRCIKPNQEKVAGMFKSTIVMDQLRLSGVLETVQIRKTGYPCRMAYKDFIGRYMILLLPKSKQEELKPKSYDDIGVLKGVAKTLLEALGARKEDWAAGKSRIFLKGELQHGLEEGVKGRYTPMVGVIQRIWRGFRVRKMVCKVIAVHREMKEIIEDLGGRFSDHLQNVEQKTKRKMVSANEHEIQLKKLDEVLCKACALEFKLAYLDTARKIRAELEVEVGIARQIADLKDCLSVPEMQAAVAQAANNGLDGPLVDFLNTRIEAVKKELALRRSLQNVMTAEHINEVRKAVEEAKNAGYDNTSKWCLPDGFQIYEKAAKNLEILLEHQQKMESAQKALLQALQDHLTCKDPKKIREVLTIADAEKVEASLVGSLSERCAVLELQIDLRESLRKCAGFDQASDVQEVMDRCKQAKLIDDEDQQNWLIEGGTEALKSAKEHLLKMRTTVEIDSEKHKAMEEEIKKMLVDCLDVHVMQGTLTHCQGLVRAMLLDKLEDRMHAVREQTPMRKALMNCISYDSHEAVEAVIQDATREGLDQEENWVLPDGMKMFLAAEHRSETLKEIELVKAKIKAAADTFDCEGIEKAIYEASALGVLQSEYLSASKLLTKLQNKHHVKGFMMLPASKVSPQAQSNLQKQLDSLNGADAAGFGASLEVILKQIEELRESCDVPAIRAILVRAKRAEINTTSIRDLEIRADVLSKQQPVFRKLKNMPFMDDLEEIREVIAKAQSMNLDKEATWMIPDGFEVYQSACSVLTNLETSKRAQQEALDEIPRTLEKLSDSFDLPAMKAVLDRAKARNVTGPVVDTVRARVDILEVQVPMLRQLKQCVAMDSEEEVTMIVGSAQMAGLDDPSKWLLAEGPAALMQAQAHRETVAVKSAESRNNEDNVIQQLEELRTSLDTVAMKFVLARAAANGIKSEVVEEIARRRDRLIEQQGLLRELKDAQVLEAEAVREILTRVRAQGLGAQDKVGWLWPQGPVLYRQALRRMLFCSKLEAIMGKLVDAARTCNAKELEKTLMEAQELGAPEAKYAEYDKLFVNLQSAAFVEGELKKLKAAASNDPVDLQRIANLVLQQKALGVKMDHEDMQAVASRMVHGKRSSTAQGTGGSVFKAAPRKEASLAARVYKELANFSKLKNPVRWDSGETGGYSIESRTQAMLSFQPEKISEALTKIAPDMEHAALAAFQDLLRCMGDKPATFAGNKEDPILEKLSSPLIDEIYVQVMKQLTNNPSVDSKRAGWVLLKKMVDEKLPPRELREFLFCFLKVRSHVEPESTTAAPVAKWEANMANEILAIMDMHPTDDPSEELAKNVTGLKQKLAAMHEQRYGKTVDSEARPSRLSISENDAEDLQEMDTVIEQQSDRAKRLSRRTGRSVSNSPGSPSNCQLGSPTSSRSGSPSSGRMAPIVSVSIPQRSGPQKGSASMSSPPQKTQNDTEITIEVAGATTEKSGKKGINSSPPAKSAGKGATPLSASLAAGRGSAGGKAAARGGKAAPAEGKSSPIGSKGAPPGGKVAPPGRVPRGSPPTTPGAPKGSPPTAPGAPRGSLPTAPSAPHGAGRSEDEPPTMTLPNAPPQGTAPGGRGSTGGESEQGTSSGRGSTDTPPLNTLPNAPTRPLGKGRSSQGALSGQSASSGASCAMATGLPLDTMPLDNPSSARPSDRARRTSGERALAARSSMDSSVGPELAKRSSASRREVQANVKGPPGAGGAPQRPSAVADQRRRSSAALPTSRSGPSRRVSAGRGQSETHADETAVAAQEGKGGAAAAPVDAAACNAASFGKGPPGKGKAGRGGPPGKPAKDSAANPKAGAVDVASGKFGGTPLGKGKATPGVTPLGKGKAADSVKPRQGGMCTGVARGPRGFASTTESFDSVGDDVET